MPALGGAALHFRDTSVSHAARVFGSTETARSPIDIPLQAGTLSKAVGAYGGYLCASQAVIDLMRSRARTFIYSTGLPPAIVAAAIAALDLIECDPAYTAEPLRKARLFTRALIDGMKGGADYQTCRRCGCRRWRRSARQRLPGHRDPSADSAARDGAAALRLYRPA